MNQPLFWEYSLSGLNLSNRFVLAPMTRSRAEQPGDIPTEMNASYYAQRATAGLIITEATQISLQGKGYANTPGIYTPDRGNAVIENQLVDLVGFGRKFLANPDYLKRVAEGASLNQITNTHTLFGGGGSEGYTDYPFLSP
jgi:2,4-dienoyl-CoA reductase-like NADH-dependent reductase (Old Yellow Enzyme family)